MRRLFLADGRADLSRPRLDMAEVEFAVFQARRPDADKRHFGIQHSGGGVRSRRADSPARCASATISLMRASTIGVRPEPIISTLARLTSTPMTLWPMEAKHAAETEPTYPNPKMLTDKPKRFSWQSILWRLLDRRYFSTSELYQPQIERQRSASLKWRQLKRSQHRNILVFEFLQSILNKHFKSVRSRAIMGKLPRCRRNSRQSNCHNLNRTAPGLPPVRTRNCPGYRE